jgi:peptidoglycan hydrolase-like protein with peptidoglycan-binding domain
VIHQVVQTPEGPMWIDPTGTGRIPGLAPVSPLTLPTLRYGKGLKPAAPDRDVLLLQQKLGITPDGRFGNDTKASVIAFQRKKGLAADGIVGPKTWTALFAVQV